MRSPLPILFAVRLLLLAVPKLFEPGPAETLSSNGIYLPLGNRNETSNFAATSTATTTTPPNATATRTSTPVSGTATRTNTPVPGTATNTSVPATATNTPVPGTATNTPTATSTGVALISSWRINTSATSAAIPGVVTDVQGVTVTAVAGSPRIRMVSNGIPAYSRTMTSDVVATLTVRPTYTGDFPGGITVAVGTPVAWGQNIGFSANTCVSPTPTAGYYPKGPACPASQGGSAVVFPLTPAPASTPSTTGGRVGYWVNGVAAFNWGDAQSYNNQNVWFRTAFHWELYDMDIDSGHASSNGPYHHHFYSGALATYVGDTGSGHSPIHGFAADGYPIHGPWHANGTLAVSGWQTRDYSESSVTGCGTGNANKRRCLMNDQTNKNGGVTMLTTTSQYGPDTNAVVNTATGRPVTTVSGVFAEDYYFDSTVCSGGQCLDKHNGHNHDSYGYHYHTTVTQESDGRLTPRFPFVVGLQYYGSLPQGTFGLSDQRRGMWAP